MLNRGDDGRVSMWCKAPPGSQAVLVGADPARFFVPPYVGPKGWVGMRLDGAAGLGGSGAPRPAQLRADRAEAARGAPPRRRIRGAVRAYKAARSAERSTEDGRHGGAATGRSLGGDQPNWRRGRAPTAARPIPSARSSPRTRRASTASPAARAGCCSTSPRPRSPTEALAALLDLARAADLEGKRAAMAAGEAVNTTERRAVLHMALRAPRAAGFRTGDGEDASADVARGAGADGGVLRVRAGRQAAAARPASASPTC